MRLPVARSMRSKGVLEGEQRSPVLRRMGKAAPRHLKEEATNVAAVLVVDTTAPLVAPFPTRRAARFAAVVVVVTAWPVAIEEKRGQIAPAEAVQPSLYGMRWFEHDGGQIIPLVATRAKAAKNLGMAHIDQGAPHAIGFLSPRVHAPNVAQWIVHIRSDPTTLANAIAVERMDEHACRGQIMRRIGKAPPSIEFGCNTGSRRVRT